MDLIWIQDFTVESNKEQNVGTFKVLTCNNLIDNIPHPL